MELREEELTEEQLQQMTELHSKNKTSHFAPSWIKSAATHGGAGARTHGGSMCATIGGMRSSQGGNLMSANGGTRSSRGGLMSANSAVRSSNIERQKEVVQFYDFRYYNSNKILTIRFSDIEFCFFTSQRA